MERNKLYLVLCGIMIILLSLTITDIFIIDIPFIYGKGSGLVSCTVAITFNLYAYFTS